MAALEPEAPDASNSPRVRFRWCRTVRCHTKEIYLVLTSLTGTQIPLLWLGDLGWFESEPALLPTGLHTGFLLIREKVQHSQLRHPKFLPTSEQSVKIAPDGRKIRERDYKVDPFYISPHKFAIELFIKEDQSYEFWQDTPALRKRYLSSQHIEEIQQKDKEEDARKWRSNLELRRIRSGDVDQRQNIELPDHLLHRGNFQVETPDGFSGSKHASHGSSSGVELFEEEFEGSVHQIPKTNLRKWCSVGDQKYSRTTDLSDSSYHSRSRSFQNYAEYDITRRGFYHKSKQAVSKTSRSEGDRISTEFLTNINSSERFSERSILDQYSPRRLVEDTERSVVAFNAYDKARIVERLLATSESEYEHNDREDERFDNDAIPSSEGQEGYGCLITFESRSTSMADLGSPRALEDVLVSLTSSDTDARHSNLFEIQLCQHIEESDSTPVNSDNLPEASTLDGERPVAEANFQFTDSDIAPETSDNPSDFDSREQESITLNEDINFQYDSIKNDFEKIPLNIKDVLDSEDSLENYPCLPDQSSSTYLTVPKDNFNESLQEIEHPVIVEISESASEESTYKADPETPKVGEYDLVWIKKSPSSANGEVATDPLILVHPGSLRSDTAASDTLTSEIHSDKSDGEVFKTSSTVRDLIGKENTLIIPTRNLKVILSESNKLENMNYFRKLGSTRTESVGTQTTYREPSTTPLKKLSKYTEVNNYPSNPAQKVPKFDLLPNKISGPWSTKKSSDFNSQEAKNLKDLQRNLYNLVKADKILRNIHSLEEDKRRAKISSPKRVSRSQRTSRSVSSISRRHDNMSSSAATIASKEKHSVKFLPPDNISPVISYRSSSFDDSPTILKEVARPILSIYGKDFLNGRFVDSLRATRSPIFSTPISGSNKMRQVRSLPNLTLSENDPLPLRASSSYSSSQRRKLPSHSVASSPTNAGVVDYSSRWKRDDAPSHDSRSFQRRRNSDQRIRVTNFHEDVESSGSTDSLIDEAEQFTGMTFCSSDRDAERKYKNRLPRRRIRRRTRSSDYVAESSPFPKFRLGDSYQLQRCNSNVTANLKTRSETDIKMIGCLTGGEQGEPPYLPYRKEQLSLGQIVKVLVPGEGVALARVVYTPPTALYDDLIWRTYDSQTVTVVLLSEPTNLSGSVITVPINKVLLAWPKTAS